MNLLKIIKELRCAVRNLFLYTRLPIHIVKRNYEHKLKELREKEKINVIFLVIENQKWNAASLYSKLLSDKRFSPIVLVIINKKENPEENVHYLFFKQRGYNVFAISKNSDFLVHKPDIVFHQQPWFALGFGFKNGSNFSPLKISKYALCLYFPYGIATTIEDKWIWNRCKLFYMTLYKQFLFNFDCVRQYETRGVYNTIATGHPTLDIYGMPIKNNPWKDSKKIKIIYAPHHCFLRSFKRATFDWNGKKMLQMVKENPHTEWIFKPHPIFKKEIMEAGILSKQEIDEYYCEWSKVGQIYDKGDYYDLFRTSDLMITDCDGFLTEYLPTGNPVIHLISSNNSTWSAVSIRSSQHYYKVHNLAELESTFDMLVNQRKDPLKEERLQDASEITFNSTDKIISEIIKYIKE